MKAFRISALSLALIAATAAAQQDDAAPSANSPSWRESAVARCQQQYSEEQCQDRDFLEENFHIESLEAAHRAATRRNRLADRAMRELILQRACTASPSKVCGGDAEVQCLAEIMQTCATLKSEAAACVQNAKNSCALTADPGVCFQQQLTQCPSTKKMPVEQLLAKYPKLSAAQKNRLVVAANDLDARTRGWWSNLVGWLK